MGKSNILYLEDVFAEDKTQTGFPGGTVVKNLPANSGDVGDTGLISGWGRSPHSNILAWKIPRTEEPGRLQSKGHKSVGYD